MAYRFCQGVSNHPLSIEAIFPTSSTQFVEFGLAFVTILCQSRLFFPRSMTISIKRAALCNHPLSIEAIFPTAISATGYYKQIFVTILCQSRLFFPQRTSSDAFSIQKFVTILCQSRLFFPPTAIATTEPTATR